MTKIKLMKDLKFCKELMERLYDYAENHVDVRGYGAYEKHTIVQNDIIRLRRELNLIREELKWGLRG